MSLTSAIRPKSVAIINAFFGYSLTSLLFIGSEAYSLIGQISLYGSILSVFFVLINPFDKLLRICVVKKLQNSIKAKFTSLIKPLDHLKELTNNAYNSSYLSYERASFIAIIYFNILLTFLFIFRVAINNSKLNYFFPQEYLVVILVGILAIIIITTTKFGYDFIDFKNEIVIVTYYLVSIEADVRNGTSMAQMRSFGDMRRAMERGDWKEAFYWYMESSGEMQLG